MNIDIQKLKAAALAASDQTYKRSKTFGQLNIQDDKYMLSDADAKYIEEASPATILSLIAAVEIAAAPQPAQAAHRDLPPPDTHCFDEDTGKDVWSYSAELMREILASHQPAVAEKIACSRCNGTGESSTSAHINWGESKCADCNGNGFNWDSIDAQPAAAQQEINAALDRADAVDAARYTAAPVRAAVVYPPDGTVSPFTVINLGSGMVKMGDAVHDDRLPALWFGKNGLGMGVEEAMNRVADDGETLAVVTFANVESLDVLLEVVQRIRMVKFPAAPSPAPVQPADAAPSQAQAMPEAWRVRHLCNVILNDCVVKATKVDAQIVLDAYSAKPPQAQQVAEAVPEYHSRFGSPEMADMIVKHAIAATQPTAQAAPASQVQAGIAAPWCNYLMAEGSVCNKCGKIHSKGASDFKTDWKNAWNTAVQIGRAAGIEEAAKYLEKLAAEYIKDHSETDPDDGSVVWEYGEAGHAYYSALTEEAEAIRALAHKPASGEE